MSRACAIRAGRRGRKRVGMPHRQSCRILAAHRAAAMPWLSGPEGPECGGADGGMSCNRACRLGTQGGPSPMKSRMSGRALHSIVTRARRGRPGSSAERARIVPSARDDGHGGDGPRVVRHLRRPDRRDRAVLAGARAAGEDRPQAPPSAAGRHPHAVPAVAGVRRPAVADRLAVGVHEAGRLPRGVRHREARRLFPRDGRKGAGGRAAGA